MAPMRLAMPLETVPATAVSKGMDSVVTVRDNIANQFWKIASARAIRARPALIIRDGKGCNRKHQNGFVF